MLKIIYIFFLALIIALFVGLGIDVFYPGPKEPEYPLELTLSNNPDSDENKSIRLDFENKQRQFEKDIKAYNQKVSIISLTIAVIILVLSFVFFYSAKVITEGVLLGGVFITCYAIIRGIMTDNSFFRFLIVCVGLVVALVLGYFKFVNSKNSEDGFVFLKKTEKTLKKIQKKR